MPRCSRSEPGNKGWNPRKFRRGSSPRGARVPTVTLEPSLGREGTLKASPAEPRRGPRLDKKLPHFLTVADATRLMESADSRTPFGRRDRAWLETLYSAGLRVSELVGLNTSDLDLSDKVLVVRGKGKKERLALIGDAAVRSLRSWLADRAAIVSELRKEVSAVFLNKNGGRLTARSVA